MVVLAGISVNDLISKNVLGQFFLSVVHVNSAGALASLIID
jgi:hypothetical protein